MNKTETKLQQTAIVLHGNHWKRLGITLGNYLHTGEATPMNLPNSDSDLSLGTRDEDFRARNSAGECHLHTVEVAGSIPAAPTTPKRTRGGNMRKRKWWEGVDKSPSPPPKPKRPGWIYFIQCETTGRIKIGWTKQTPPDRLRDIKTASATNLRILTACHAAHQEEFELHRKFTRWRLHGEWFENSLAVQRHIESVLRLHGADPWVPPESRRPVETAEEIARRAWHHNQYLDRIEAGEITFAEDDLHGALYWSEIRRRRRDFPGRHPVRKPDPGEMVFG